MSLIQEALKKQQEEMDAAQTSPGDAQPEQTAEPGKPIPRSALRTKPLATQEPVPPPAKEATIGEATKSKENASDDKPKDEKEKESSIWPSLFGALAFLTVIALLLYGSWFGYLTLRRGQEANEVSESMPLQEVDEATTDIPEPAEPVPDTTVAVVPDLPTAEDVVVPEPEAVEPSTEVAGLPVTPPAETEPEAPITTDEHAGPPPAEALPVESPTTPDAMPPAVEPSTSVNQKLAEEPKPAGKEPWPVLTLDGFVGRGKSGTAVLNGEIVPVGNTIQDVEVMLIESRSVILKYNGQLRRIRRGQTTN